MWPPLDPVAKACDSSEHGGKRMSLVGPLLHPLFLVL